MKTSSDVEQEGLLVSTWIESQLVFMKLIKHSKDDFDILEKVEFCFHQTKKHEILIRSTRKVENLSKL